MPKLINPLADSVAKPVQTKPNVTTQPSASTTTQPTETKGSLPKNLKLTSKVTPTGTVAAPAASGATKPTVSAPVTKPAVSAPAAQQTPSVPKISASQLKPVISAPVVETKPTETRNVSEIYSSVTAGTSNPLNIHSDYAIERKTELKDYYNSTVAPAYEAYKAAKDGFAAGTVTADALKQAERNYKLIYNQSKPLWDAYETLWKTDDLHGMRGADSESLANTLAKWNDAAEAAAVSLENAEQKLNELSEKYNAEADAFSKALSEFNGIKKPTQEQYNALMKQQDRLLALEDQLAGAVGDYRAQTWLAGEMVDVYNTGAEMWEKQYLKEHPEYVWYENAKTKFDANGKPVSVGVKAGDLFDRIEDLKGRRAGASGDQLQKINDEIAVYYSLLNDGLPYANMTIEDTKREEERFQAKIDALEPLMSQYAWVEDFDRAAEAGLVYPMPAGRDYEADKAEYQRLRSEVVDAKGWLTKIGQRRYEQTYDPVIAGLKKETQDLAEAYIQAIVDPTDASGLATNPGLYGQITAGDGGAVYGDISYIDASRAERKLAEALRGEGLDDRQVNGVLRYVKYEADARAATNLANSISEEARDSSLFANFLMQYLLSIPSGAGAVENILQGINRYGNGDESYKLSMVDPYTGEYAPINFSTFTNRIGIAAEAFGEGEYQRILDAVVDSDAPEAKQEKQQRWAQFLYNAYNLAQSMGQSTTIALMGGAGMKSAVWILSGSAAASTMQEMHRQGFSDTSVLVSGIVAGLAEYYTEKYSLEKLLEVFERGTLEGLTKGQLIRALGLNRSLQALAEASEEGASTLINTVYDFTFGQLLNGGLTQIEYNALQAQQENPGLSWEAAVDGAYKDWMKGLGSDMLGGFLSGWIMGGGSFYAGYLKGQSQAKTIGRAIQSQGLNSQQLFDAAEKLQDSVAAIENSLKGNLQGRTSAQIGRLFSKYQDTTFFNAAAERLKQLGEKNVTPELLHAIRASANGDYLSTSDRLALQNSKYASQVSAEIKDYWDALQAEQETGESVDMDSMETWIQDAVRQQNRDYYAYTQTDVPGAEYAQRVSEAEAQYNLTKEQNPGATVLNQIQDDLAAAGADETDAVKQGSLLTKIFSGQKLTYKEMRTLDLNNKAVREVFVKRSGLTGVPEGKISYDLKATYANRVATENRLIRERQRELAVGTRQFMETQQKKQTDRLAAIQAAAKDAPKNGFANIFEKRKYNKQVREMQAELSTEERAAAAARLNSIDVENRTEEDVVRQIRAQSKNPNVLGKSTFEAWFRMSTGITGEMTPAQQATMDEYYLQSLKNQGLTNAEITALTTVTPSSFDARSTGFTNTVEAGTVAMSEGMNRSLFSEQQELSVRVLEKLAKELGLRIQLYETQNVNGQWVYITPDGHIISDNGFYDGNTGTIYLDINAGENGQQVILYAASHELTHLIKQYAPEEFDTLKYYLFLKYAQHGQSVNDLIHAQIQKAAAQGRKITRAVAEEEVVADSMEKMLTGGDLLQSMQEIAKERPSLAQRIIDFLHNWFNKLQGMYDKLDPDSKEGKLVGEMTEALGDFQKLWLKGLSAAAQNMQDAAPKDIDGDPAPIQYSMRSMAQGAGFTISEDGTVYDQDGKVVKKVTAEQMKPTPLGQLVTDALSAGNISSDGAKKQYEFLAELMNQIIEKRDAALIWEFTGAQMFSAIRSNSDKQYGLTIDFSTICKKTQQMVDVMSGAMMELGHGLTREQVEMAYQKVAAAGEPVPCPVCYVFSRWIGIGGILDSINRYQAEFADMSEEDLRRFMLDREAEAKAFAEEKIKNAKDPDKKREDFYDKKGRLKIGGIMSEMKSGPNNRISSRQKKIDLSLDCSMQIEALKAEAAEAEKLGVPFAFRQQNLDAIANLQKKVLSEEELRRLEQEINELQDQLRPIEAYQYLNGTIMLQQNGEWVKNKKFKPVPPKVLFNLNAGSQFAKEYPYSWKYRTTRGCAAGKAMLPFSDARVGEAIQGIRYSDVSKIYTNPEDSPFFNGDEADRQDVVEKARIKQRRQNLIGGMRFQSTSDFRFEYGSDYLITFMEMQAIGANVQLYTKVVEAVDFLATMGADCNLSVMPLGDGYVVNADGSTTLVFSPVTGMDGDAAIKKAKEYDNVQLILVGISDEHIRTALAGTEVTFVIPFHGSGNTTANIQTLMDALSESLDLTKAKDYTKVQSDHFAAKRTTEQKAMWNLRMDIIQGKAAKLDEKQQALLEKNQYLKDLWRRFYVEGVDPKTYQCFLGKEQAEQIFPYEYWDKTSTYENADINGGRFQEYCATMGIVPRFSGIDSDGNALGYGDFTKDKGYWKLLIDRKMYENTYDEKGNWTGYGKYRDQQAIDCSNFEVKTLDPSWAYDTYGDVMTAANDPSKTQMLVDSVVNAIRDGERVDVMHSGREVTDAEQRRLDEQEFVRTIDQWIRDGKPGGEIFRLGTTSDVLQGLGAIESDIYIYSDKLNTMQDPSDPGSYHPEMTDDMIKKIPKILNDPVLILVSNNATSKNRMNTRVLIFGAYKANNGQNPMVVFDFSPSGNDLLLNTAQLASSAYTKTTNPVRFVNGSEVLYVDEKRAGLALRPMGFQMPMGWNHVGSIGNITYTKRGVKFSGTDFSKIATPGTANPNPVRHSARGGSTRDFSGVTQGLNFRDPTGELLDRVFDGSKKYETRRYTVSKGNGKLAGAFLNKPMGIVQTGAGPAQLVGFWELGDGQLRDYEWLKEHAAELGNDGTEFEAKPGEKKWVYPIKWAERTDPAPVTGGNQVVRDISGITSQYAAADEVSAETIVEELEDHVFADPEIGERVMHSVRENQKDWNPLRDKDGNVVLVYKAFYAYEGGLYPPMISNMSDQEKKKVTNAVSGTLSGLDTPGGVVLDAEVGQLARYKADTTEYDVAFRKLWKGSSKAIKRIKAELKAEGFNIKSGLNAEARAAAEAKMEREFPKLKAASKEKIVERAGELVRNESGRLAVVNSKGGGTLAFRPGWHLGQWPNLRQFDVDDPVTGKERSAMPDSLVFCACEIAGDIDYQLEAMELGMTANGGFDRTQAGLPYVPVNGYYKYRTNADPTTEPWYITGAIKVVAVLDDEDCRRICAQYGVTPQPRVSHQDIDLAKYGLKRGPIEAPSAEKLQAYKKSQAAIQNEEALAEALADPNYQEAYASRPINFNDKEIMAEFARNYQDADYYRDLYEKKQAGLLHSSRNANSVEAAIEQLDQLLGKGSAQQIKRTLRAMEQRADQAAKALMQEKAERALERKELKQKLVEAKKVLDLEQKQNARFRRVANTEANRLKREMQQKETALKKRIAEASIDTIWKVKLAESNGEQELKAARRFYEGKMKHDSAYDREWARRKYQSGVHFTKEEGKRRTREAVSLERRVLSLPGRAAATELRKFRNKEQRVLMNDDSSVCTPLNLKDEGKFEVPKTVDEAKKKFGDAYDKFYRAMVNDVAELDRMAKLQTRTDNLSVQVNMYRASRATPEIMYATGMVDRAGNIIGKAMKDVVLCLDEKGNVNEKMQNALQDYMFHKHNVDRMSLEKRAVDRVKQMQAQYPWLAQMTVRELAQAAAEGNSQIITDYVNLLHWANNVKNKAVMPDGDNYAVTAEASQAVVDVYESEMPWLVDKANEIYNWWDQFMMEWAVGNSISLEDYEEMREMYPHYVPTYREMKGEHTGKIRSTATGLSSGEVVRSAKGSLLPLINLEDQYAKALRSIVENNRQNEVLRTLGEELLFDDDGIFADYGVYDWKSADQATLQNFWDFADEQQRTSVEKVKIDGQDAYHISWWVDGVKMSAYVNRAMFEGLQSLFGVQSDFARTVTKIGRTVTRPMKAAITGYNLTFAFKNIARDQHTAMTNSNAGISYWKYLGQAAAKMASNDSDWIAFQSLGGVSSTQTRMEGGFARAMSPAMGLRKAWKGTLNFFGSMGEWSESVSRFAEYLATIDLNGGDTYENRLAAIRAAAEVTVDFGRSGTWGKVVNACVPYWNPNVQGLDKMIRNIKDQPDVKSMLARTSRAVLVNLIPAALQAALIHARGAWKDYEELNDQQKDNYYCIPIGEHKFWKIPKSQDWAAFISTPFIRLMEGVNGRDDPFEGWFESAVMPNMPFDMRDIGLGVEVPVIMPIFMDDMMDLAANKNWAGSAIIPYDLSKLSSKEQFDADTSILARAFGEIFNASPMAVDYIIDNYFGNFWGTILKAIPLSPLSPTGYYTGDIRFWDKAIEAGSTILSPFIADNRYSSSTLSAYYDMIHQMEQEIEDAGGHGGDKKNAEHYEIYKALTQSGGFVDQISRLNAQAREQIGEEKGQLRWEVIGYASQALEFVRKCERGEIKDPELWMTYHGYGNKILKEAEALKKYADDYNFSGKLGQPKVLYDRSGDVDIKYELTDDQQRDYQDLRAEQYMQALNTVINDKAYADLKPEEKAARLEAAKRIGLQQAERLMIRELRSDNVKGETVGKVDHSAEQRAAAYSVSWLLGEDRAYKPELTDEFVRLYDYNDTYSFVPSEATKKTFKDPGDGSKVYVLDSAQQKKYAEVYHDAIAAAYSSVIGSREYKEASDELRAAMLSKARTYVNEDVKTDYDAWLKSTGAEAMTLDQASGEISLEAKYAVQRALGDDHAMQEAVTDELIRLYQYSDVGEVEFFPITTAPKQYVDDRDKDYVWQLDADQREVYMGMMFDIYQRNILKVMNSSAYQKANEYEQAQMLCDVRSRLSGEVQAEFKHWLRTTNAPRTFRKSTEAKDLERDIAAAGKIVDQILGKSRTYKDFNKQYKY